MGNAIAHEMGHESDEQEVGRTVYNYLRGSTEYQDFNEASARTYAARNTNRSLASLVSCPVSNLEGPMVLALGKATLLSIAPVILIACASVETTRADRSGRELPVVNDTSPQRIGYGAENEQTLYGSDKLTLTRARISETQGMLRRYCESHGQYPSILTEALPAPRSEWTVVYDFDGWEQPILYTGADDEYTLRSAGPDKRVHTADDVIGTSTLQVTAFDVSTVSQTNPCARPR